MDGWVPRLTLHERNGHCRLALCGLAHGEGLTLQEAADDLVASLEAIALAVRHGRLPFSTELPPDGDVIAFLDDVARLAGERDALRSYVLRDS